MVRLSLIATLVVLAPLGCMAEAAQADGTGPATSSHAEALTLSGPNVVWRLPGGSLDLVGRDLNGQNLNGSVLDGRRLQGIGLGNAQVGGNQASASIEGSELVVTDSRGPRLRAERVTGTTFLGRVDDGSELPLTIDAVQRDAESKDLFRYTVSYQTNDGPRSLCGLDSEGNPIAALALRGRWDLREGVPGGGSHLEDANAFTFACEGFVIAKCVSMGYAPWRPVLACRAGSGCQRTTLAAAHQACTRMLRADYCGDGVSHTHDGVLVNSYDAIGIRADSEAWPVEAEWDEAGARCAIESRLPSQPMPQCAAVLASKQDCGSLDHFELGTLLISEVQP